MQRKQNDTDENETNQHSKASLTKREIFSIETHYFVHQNQIAVVCLEITPHGNSGPDNPAEKKSCRKEEL